MTSTTHSRKAWTDKEGLVSQAQSHPSLEPRADVALSPSSVEGLPENHLVFFLQDLAAELDR